MSRTQFSIRTLLAAVAVVGIGAALWVAEPSWYVGAVEALLLAWVPASTAILATQSTGRLKAFWIGATAELTVPSTVLLLCVLSTNIAILPDGEERILARTGVLPYFLYNLADDFRSVLIAWAFAPVVGLLCVLTHWLFIRPPQGPQD